MKILLTCLTISLLCLTLAAQAFSQTCKEYHYRCSIVRKVPDAHVGSWVFEAEISIKDPASCVHNMVIVDRGIKQLQFIDDVRFWFQDGEEKSVSIRSAESKVEYFVGGFDDALNFTTLQGRGVFLGDKVNCIDLK